jgi:hypothetical protein
MDADALCLQLLFAFSGKDGSLLWEFGNHDVQSDLMSVYAAQFVQDLNGDGRPEVLAVHGGDELSDPGINIEYDIFYQMFLDSVRKSVPHSKSCCFYSILFSSVLQLILLCIYTDPSYV